MSINPINIEPGQLPPAGEAAMLEVARLFPIAYRAAFDLTVALSAVSKARGMVGSGLAEAAQRANRQVSDASSTIAVAPDAIRSHLRMLGMDQ